MLSLIQFTDKIKQLHGKEELTATTGKYLNIEVTKDFIFFIRQNKAEINVKSKLIVNPARENISLDALYKVYCDFKELNKVEINKRLKPGNHYSPASCFMKTLGIYDSNGIRNDNL